MGAGSSVRYSTACFLCDGTGTVRVCPSCGVGTGEALECDACLSRGRYCRGKAGVGGCGWSWYARHTGEEKCQG